MEKWLTDFCHNSYDEHHVCETIGCRCECGSNKHKMSRIKSMRRFSAFIDMCVSWESRLNPRIGINSCNLHNIFNGNSSSTFPQTFFFHCLFYGCTIASLSLARSDGPFQLHWRKCTWLIWLLPGVASSEIINQFIFSHLLDDMMLFSHKSLNNRLSNAFIKQRWLLLRSLLLSGLHTHAGS